MYFENAGKENTEKVIELAVKTANEKGIKHIVIASHGGYTASLLNDCGLNVTVITHAYGTKEPGVQDMSSEMMNKLKNFGFNIYSGTHLLSGAERAFSNKFSGISPVEIMAHTLRMFGQGMKVSVEIATMALDGGLIPYGQDIIAIGGTKQGADTAVIIKPAHAKSILDTKIKEIICKPL